MDNSLLLLVRNLDEARTTIEAMEGVVWGVGSKKTVGPISREEDQSYGMVIPVCDLYGGWEEANAKGIVCAKNLVPGLLDRASDLIESQTAEIERLNRVVDFLMTVSQGAIRLGEISRGCHCIYAPPAECDVESFAVGQEPELYEFLTESERSGMTPREAIEAHLAGKVTG